MGMDKFLVDGFREFTPQANHAVLNGITVEQMRYFESSIDRFWRTIDKDFPPQLRYLGYRPCSPEEEYRMEPRIKKSSREEVDIAQNSIYMVNYRFGYVHESGQVEELPPVYMFLPYVSEAGTLMLSGSRWMITPMLGDVVMSFEPKRIFCQFSRAKFHINNQSSYTIYQDDQPLHVDVPWSVLYNINSKSVSRRISLLHYVFAKYGLRKTYQRYFPQLDVEFFDEDPGFEKYPQDQYVRITGFKGKAKPFFGGTNIVTLLPRNQYVNAPSWFKTFLGCTYYVLDRFGPEGSKTWNARMKADPEFSENLEQWRIMMGRIIWENTKNPGDILDDINKHMRSLDRYVDDIVRPRAQRIGFQGENLYDFLVMCIQNWEYWQLNWHRMGTAIYEKEINVLYQIDNGIMQEIFRFYFALENEAPKGFLTKEKAHALLKRFIKPRMIFSIRKAHRYVYSISYSGDNKFCRITSVVAPQKGTTGGNDTVSTAGTRLHASLAEVTSPLNLTKQDPTGLTRLNPFVHLDNLMYIRRDPECAALTDHAQAILDKEMRATDVEEEFDIQEMVKDAKSD